MEKKPESMVRFDMDLAGGIPVTSACTRRFFAVVAALSLGLSGCGSDDAAPAQTADSSESAGVANSTVTDTPPSTDVPTEVKCSAAELASSSPRLEGLPAPAQETAKKLFNAAVACDQKTLVQLATEGETSLSFGSVTPDEVFELPESQDRPYFMLATLLSSFAPTPNSTVSEDGNEVSNATDYVWPPVYTATNPSDEQWQEAITAGLLSPEDAEEQRASGSGYVGYRVGINEQGSWTFFLAGD